MPNPDPRRRAIQTAVESIASRAKARRSKLEKLEDRIVATFGTVEFLIINMLLFASWIVFNSGLIPGVVPFDPYPFIFLTMIVSLAAAFLAVFVLITQNRQERINSLREETNLQIELISEQEITKVLEILTVVVKKMGIDTGKDLELKKMLKPLNAEELERKLEEQLKR